MSHFNRHVHATVALRLKDFHLGTTLVKVLDNVQVRPFYAQGQTPQKYHLCVNCVLQCPFRSLLWNALCHIQGKKTHPPTGKHLALALNDPTILDMFNISLRFKYS